jgi:multidrug efflux pump subunit AcrA (membrane-fusion protein)
MRRSWCVLVLVAFALACEREDKERGERVQHAQRATVPGVETVAATVEDVRDLLVAFGTVAAEAEPAEVRDARAQLAEAEARQRLAEQQLVRLEALARGAVAPRKELEAAHAEQASAVAAAARARQVLASFGSDVGRTPLVAAETWVIAQLMQTDVGRVQAGADARFAADAFAARRFDGQVDAAPAYVDPTTRTAPVRLRVRDPERVLRPGMTGAVTVAAGLSRSAVLVPAAAVVFDGAQAVVFVEESAAHYVPHPVRLGVTRDGRIEITTGLTAGARVAVTGAASLLSATRLPAAIDEE